MKIAVIGGSTYTPKLVNGFLARTKQFPLDELWLMDIDAERLEIVGRFAQRMVAAKASPFKVIFSTNQRESIKDADYITPQLGGSTYDSTVATQLLNAHYNDLSETHVVNIKNNGAAKECPADWVLEIPSVVKKSGITPSHPGGAFTCSELRPRSVAL